jgi:hypothetical protein
VHGIAEALRRGGLCLRRREHRGCEERDRRDRDALVSSKILLVYYSAGFPSRPACQFELTAACSLSVSAAHQPGKSTVMTPRRAASTPRSGPTTPCVGRHHR